MMCEPVAALLLSHLQIADRWVVPGCVRACCKALTALPAESLTLEDVLEIYAPGRGPLPPSLLRNTEFKTVMQAGLWKLLQLFGDVPTVVASAPLTAQLLQLPHAAFLALLTSDHLNTDCEDSVLMLLSWWLEGETTGGEDRRSNSEDGKSEEGTEAQQEMLEGERWQGDVEDKARESVEEAEPAHEDRPRCDGAELLELMEAIRYSRLSSTYISQVLPKIPGLEPSKAQLAELHQFRSLKKVHAVMYRRTAHACPPGWFRSERPVSRSRGSGRSRDTVSLRLVISKAELGAHLHEVLAKREQGGPEARAWSTRTDFRGLQLTFYAGSYQAGGLLDANVSVTVRLPRHDSRESIELGVPGSCTFAVTSSDPRIGCITLENGTSFVRSNWARNVVQAASELPGNPLLMSWWEPFMAKGALRLEVEVTDERRD
ncbi:MAG: hypothetical protein WDW36_005348 [Sanguina aurantia]